jgi:hypothetical protein
MNDYWLSHAGIRKAAQDAMQVQDACNLSGVINAWNRAMTALWEVAHRDGHGTSWVNTHPINRLFASKVFQLTGMEHGGDFRGDDFAFVKNMAEGKPRTALLTRVGA